MFSIPTCFFPSTTVFIDDCRDFLLNFTLQLPDTMSYEIYSSPQKALDAVLGRASAQQIDKRCISEYSHAIYSPQSNHTINLDLSVIKNEVYNSTRFSELSVIVVDYAMPGMNGIEVCEQLQNNPIKKILLTGQADEKIAIEAFNRGIIDAYVQKQDPAILALIRQRIHDLQKQYFQVLSDMIIKILAVYSPLCLQDPKFVAFFRELRHKHKIVEFYLIESSGSFLMLDADAKPYYLIVNDEDTLNLHSELAKDTDLDPALLAQLTAGQKIPYFSVTDSDPQHRYETGLLPAQKITCDRTYYYTLIDDPLLFDMQLSNIQSYHRYLESQDTKTDVEPA